MDILIKNGLVCDGSGALPVHADVLIQGEKIARIAPRIEAADLNAADTEVVDAGGKLVTPGFIDIHRHCDIMPFKDSPFGEIELRQGITTTFVGNCGLAPVPSAPETRAELYSYLEPVIGAVPKDLVFETYADYFTALEQADLPLNIGVLAGSDSIKIAVKGFGNQAYTDEEMERARALVRQALDQGAFGLTLGIMYQPECYSSREELTAVVQAAAGPGRVLCTHIRGEGNSLVESVDEVIDVAAQAGIALNISHLKATGVKNWNKKIHTAIARIEQARAAGQDVTADFYPYDGGSTTLQSLLPPTVMAESLEQLIRNLSGPEGRKRLREELAKEHDGWDNMAESIGWDRILISSVTLPEHHFMLGRSVGAAAEEAGYAEPADLAADLLVAEEGRVGIIVLSMSQEDVDTVAGLPYTMLISDALYGGESKHAHPRLLGATARFIRNYTQKRNVISLAEAIKKMTFLPAQRMGLPDRGLIKEGYQADLLVFAPEQFQDHADYTGSHELCTGMDLVLLGGRKVLADGKVLDTAQGRLLRRNQ